MPSARVATALGVCVLLALMVVLQQLWMTRLQYDLSATDREVAAMREEARVIATQLEAARSEERLAERARDHGLDLVPPEIASEARDAEGTP